MIWPARCSEQEIKPCCSQKDFVLIDVWNVTFLVLPFRHGKINSAPVSVHSAQPTDVSVCLTLKVFSVLPGGFEADVPPQGLFTCSACPLSRSLPLRRSHGRVSRRVQVHVEDQVPAPAGVRRVHDRVDQVPRQRLCEDAQAGADLNRGADSEGEDGRADGDGAAGRSG